jgi:hypothetical protein
MVHALAQARFVYGICINHAEITMTPLRELVRLYLQHSGEFGKPVALSLLGLSAAETERLFSGYDEDYHISRFLKFSDAGGPKFSINGIPATHVSLDAEIQSIL